MNPDIQQVMDFAYYLVNDVMAPGGFVKWFCIILPTMSLGVTLGNEMIKKLRKAFDMEFEEEKRKNEKLKNEDLVLEEEKPKRGRMLIGDDGELLEIVEDDNERYQ